MAWPSNRADPSPPPPSQLDTVIGDLQADTLRRLAAQYLRDHHRAMKRIRYLKQSEKWRREASRIVIPLTPTEQKKVIREARNLAIVRAAWAGKTNRALAAAFQMSEQQIGRIIRSSLKERARAEPDQPAAD